MDSMVIHPVDATTNATNTGVDMLWRGSGWIVNEKTVVTVGATMDEEEIVVGDGG